MDITEYDNEVSNKSPNSFYMYIRNYIYLKTIKQQIAK